MDSRDLKYWAFISYSRTDVAWAKWLHDELESYHVPSWLRGQNGRDGPIPAQLFPIYIDLDEARGGADIGAEMRRSLARSRHLIVICSPRSATSRWVNEEIRYFKSLGRSDRILCLIIDGEPNAAEELGKQECFPPAVRLSSLGNGNSTNADLEPIAPDVRKGKDSRRKALLRLLAGILDVDFNVLWRREFRRSVRRYVGRAAAVLLIMAAAGLTYIAAADDGVQVPGGPSIRLILDRYAVSVFRPAHSMGEIVNAASLARDALIDRVHREWAEGAWVYNNSTRIKGPKIAISPWVSSQAVCAVFRAISAGADLRDFWDVLNAPFADGSPIVAENGEKLGWLVGDAEYPRATPALWTLAAVAAGFRHARQLDDDGRRLLLSRLQYTEEVARLYQPVPGAGWNALPHQHDPTQHTIDTTALALLAMLEVRRANLAWDSDPMRLDFMIADTIMWLISQFDDKSKPPGWHIHLNDTGIANTGEISDGLTLQIYSELLRAEEVADITIPQVVLEAIPRHIDSLLGRPANYVDLLECLPSLSRTGMGCPQLRR